MTEKNNNGGIFSVDIEKGVLVLEDEDGNKGTFLIEADIDVDSKRYLVICHEDEVESGEFFALRVEEDAETGDSYLNMVEDEEELNKIQEALDEYDEEYEEDEDEDEE